MKFYDKEIYNRNEKIKAVTFISFIDNSIEDEYINLMKKSNVLDIMNFLNEK